MINDFDMEVALKGNQAMLEISPKELACTESKRFLVAR